MDRLESMTAFVEVVTAGSFAAAADRLGISAPMVGKHIRSLEERLNVRLIDRTTRRQNLTDAGRLYLDYCRSILSEISAVETLVAEQSNEPRGWLRVTMPTAFGRHCVAPILLGMSKSHADLKVDLVLTDEVVELDDFHLAIRSLSPHSQTLPGESGLSSRKLCEHEMVICGSPSYLKEHGTPKALDELALHKRITFGKARRQQPWLFPGPRRLASFDASSATVMNDIEAIADAAEAGLGLAWLPTWLIRGFVASHRLEVIPLAGGNLRYSNYALWHTHQLTPKIRVSIDTLSQRLPNLMALTPIANRWPSL